MSDKPSRRVPRDPLWRLLCERLEQVSFDGLQHHEQVFVAVTQLRAQVDNGGFAQYMFNSYGERAELALKGLREVGAHGAARACAGFFALLPGKLPVKERVAREKQLHVAAKVWGSRAFESACTDLQRQFYSSERELEDCLRAYAQKHGMAPSPL